MWAPVDVVDSTGSTNADLLTAAVAGGTGGRDGRVLVAEEQTAGRGRYGRTWTSVSGASLTFSVLLRPASVPPGRRGWLPLLAGVAIASAVRTVSAGTVSAGTVSAGTVSGGTVSAGTGAGVGAVLKWPNDVLVGERKLAGILAEQAPDGDAVVIGVGLNVATPADALPVSPSGLRATSLLAEGAVVARETLLLAILDQLEERYAAFRADPDPVRTGLRDAYRALSSTLGQPVRVELPAGRLLMGMAADIDPDGRLLVAEEAGQRVTPVSAGDVIHVRS
jgi:BirA family transcriptional regulator, biotin operon repressor / biotin---[acetyl-CoA-carboxylase] ligase